MTGAPATLRQWLAEPLPEEVRGPIDRLVRADDVRAVVVLPDVHWAENVCVGIAVATGSLLYPQAVGSDIGCGMAALRLCGTADLLATAEPAARVLAGLERVLPTIRRGGDARLPDDLQSRPLSAPALDRLARRDGRVEFATLGRGNHFLELQRDAEDQLWLMVHSGSRAMGPAILRHHVRRGRATSSGLVALQADSAAGQDYLADLDWAIAYARHSRRAMAESAAALLGELFGLEPDWSSWIACVHNHVARECHGGETLWVHRKGAMPLLADELGVVPGSMGTASFHVAGRGVADALCTSAHGAGRQLGRAAARRLPARQFLRRMHGVWFDHRRTEALKEESPDAYKDIGAVMRAQRDLVRVVRRLDPVLSYKGT
jgi:tRNA-splicing ligase RtcB